MKLIKTSILTSIITFIRLVSSFISNKIVAVYLGATGIASIGLFNNLLTILNAFSNGGINQGVIKYTAEFKNNDQKIKELFSTSLIMTLISSCFIGIFIIIFSKYINYYLLKNITPYYFIIILGITIVFNGMYNLFISIINGNADVKLYTIINSVTTIFNLFLTIILVKYWKLNGAILSLVLSNCIFVVCIVYYVFYKKHIDIKKFQHKFSKLMCNKLLHYSLVALITATITPFCQIIIRDLIINKMGFVSAGYWQGITRISDSYLLFFTTSLSVYYLPKLSNLVDKKDLKYEIVYGYKVLVFPVMFITIFIYLFRQNIINILFTSNFKPMENLFLYQLIGDIFKIASWVLSYLLIAKKMIKELVFTEIIFNLLLVLLSYLFLNKFELIGITLAFALNYFLYLLCMIYIFRKTLFFKYA